MADVREINDLFEEAAAAYEEGRLDAAEALCHQLLEAAPGHAPAVSLMGVVLCRTGRAELGVQFIEKAVDLAPGEVAFLNNLGTALTGLGRAEDAVAAFARAIDVAPDYPPAHNNIGAALRPLGRLDEAAAHYAKAVELAPDYGEAWANYANVLMDLDRVDDAEAAAAKACELRPDYAVAHNNLGTVLQRRGRYADAEAHFLRALALDPDYADALSNLGEVLKDTGRAADALQPYERSVALSPDEPGMASNMLLALCNIAGMAPAEIARRHTDWGAVLNTGPAPDFAGRDRDPERRLRVGYVSPDFRRHSVAYFLEPLLAHHDKRAVEVFCYANMAGDGDAVTARLRGHAEHWRPVFGMDDAALADLIRADGIDVLVDLAGHTRGNRLGAFARRCAPVQLSYLGYPATTGVAAMDGRLTDAAADPPGATEAFHTEDLVRIEPGFLCYAPDPEAPTVAPPPADANGFVTFGSFNNLAKVTPDVIAAWAGILTDVPDSRLVLKAKALGDPAVQDRVRAAFAGHGVDPGRVDCRGWIVDGAPLDAYGQIDIGLDTFPYNGTTTTAEALWMGVPVVALAGDWHAARVGASILGRAGLDDWIAPDPGAYRALAAARAGDLAGLGALRAGLRDKLEASGFTDGGPFAAAVEAAYRDAWRRRCGDLS
ncbi:MAG: tetratricopeptide repeat protein [Magnetovibrio sp.]|nr:tetratricopeptide repeat protein [Magnetovibrio sp.]